MRRLGRWRIWVRLGGDCGSEVFKVVVLEWKCYPPTVYELDRGCS